MRVVALLSVFCLATVCFANEEESCTRMFIGVSERPFVKEDFLNFNIVDGYRTFARRVKESLPENLEPNGAQNPQQATLIFKETTGADQNVDLDIRGSYFEGDDQKSFFAKVEKSAFSTDLIGIQDMVTLMQQTWSSGAYVRPSRSSIQVHSNGAVTRLDHYMFWTPVFNQTPDKIVHRQIIVNAETNLVIVSETHRALIPNTNARVLTQYEKRAERRFQLPLSDVQF